MRKLLLSITITLLAGRLFAQQPAVSIYSGIADPPNCKSPGRNIYLRNDTGVLKVCNAGVWTSISSGTVTSVGLAGTANQITVTGTSPITTSGSWTLSFPVGGVTLPATTTGAFSGGLTGNVTGNVSGSSGSTTGNAATASASDHSPTACGANTFAQSQSTVWAFTCAVLTLTSAQFANQGTTTTVLHGAAAGNPSWAQVVSADMNITTSTCTNQFVSAISSGGIGTCTTDTLASAQHANQGTTTTLLHGAAAGNPSFGAVVSADLNITTTTCTNQFLSVISASGTGTCTTDTLASAQHANQGTTTTVLHGAAAGNPSFASVALADMATQVTNSVVGNATSGTTTPTALAVGTCSGATNALNWTTNTGFGCNGSITANTATTATTATNQSGGTVSATTIAASSTITPSSTAGIVGTTTNDNANAGSIGEVISATLATGSSVSLSTTVQKTVTSLSLTAGDWDCSGSVDYTFGATTTYTVLDQSISTTNNVIGPQGSFSTFTTASMGAPTRDPVWVTPVTRISVASTTTVYLVAYTEFAISTLRAYGDIRCRRMR